MTANAISQIDNLSKIKIESQDLDDSKSYNIFGTILTFQSNTENEVLVYIMKQEEGQELIKLV